MSEKALQVLARRGSPFIIQDLKIDKEKAQKYRRFTKDIIFSFVSAFLATVGRINNVDSLIDGIVQSIETSLIYGFEGPGTYIFDYNPIKEGMSSKKLANAYRLGFDYFDVQYFDDDLKVIRFNGIVGRLYTEPGVVAILKDAGLQNLNSYLLSARYYKFLEFEYFLKDVSSLLAIMTIDKTYVGFVVDFSWDWDASDAYKINYSLTLNVYPVPLFTGSYFTGKNFIKSEIKKQVMALADRKFLFYTWE